MKAPSPKVLILHPDLNLLGGIESYYRKMDAYFTIDPGHLVIGKRPGEAGRMVMVQRLLGDYWQFFRRLKRDQYDLVLLNPSLSRKAIIREGFFLRLARLRGKKTVVFFRGWEQDFAAELAGRRRWLFDRLFKDADAFIVLAEAFRRTLREWGCSQPIHREVTVAEDQLMDRLDFPGTLEARLNDSVWRIIFPSRILKSKGVYELVDAYALVKAQHPNVELLILGDGEEMSALQNYAAQQRIDGIRFTGYVDGEVKHRLFRSAHLLCFPTRHEEGMPNTLVEAMAFGLPVVTRLAGGIGDFFREGEHGFATDSADPQVFAALIEKLYRDRELYRRISINNFEYASTHFRASQAAARLEAIFASVMESSDW